MIAINVLRRTLPDAVGNFRIVAVPCFLLDGHRVDLVPPVVTEVKPVTHAGYVTIKMVEVAVPRESLTTILERTRRLVSLPTSPASSVIQRKTEVIVKPTTIRYHASRCFIVRQSAE